MPFVWISFGGCQRLKPSFAELDTPKLLQGHEIATVDVDALDEDALLAELGIGDETVEGDDITVLRHVRSSTEKTRRRGSG